MTLPPFSDQPRDHPGTGIPVDPADVIEVQLDEHGYAEAVIPPEDTQMTLTCPRRAQPPVVLDAPWYAVLAGPVMEDRCPLSGDQLAPQNVAVGIEDGKPVQDTRGRCPVPCETVWWMEGGAPCYAGREIRLDFTRPAGSPPIS